MLSEQQTIGSVFNNLIDNALYSTGDGVPTTVHMAAITFYVALGKKSNPNKSTDRNVYIVWTMVAERGGGG